MNYAAIKYSDIANGPGVRTVLFVSGCTHHCPDCFQPETWSFSFGRPYTPEVEEEIIASLKEPWVSGITILGGEPMEPVNQAGLLPLLQRIRRECPGKTIWVYTGDVYENLLYGGRNCLETADLFDCIDVLVDGPFAKDLKDISLRFRGSSNQRIIDVPASLAAGEVVLWEDDPQFASHKMV